jgi:hypothetical protein
MSPPARADGRSSQGSAGRRGAHYSSRTGVGDGEPGPDDPQSGRANRARRRFAVVSAPRYCAGLAIRSFSSVQVLRTSAVTCEQISISRKTRLASSR